MDIDRKSQGQEDPGIAEQALEWFEVMKRGSPQDRAAFTGWLKLSPRHVGEFLLVSAMYRQFDGANPAYQIDVDQLLAAQPSNVLTLETEGTTANRAEDTLRATREAVASARKILARRWAAGVAAGICVLALTGTWLTRGLAPGQNYATAIGELRSFELPDGSVVHLNTRSRIQVQFSGERRDIRLLGGEALFQVARDPSRPFRVLAENAVIQAVGTQFNVYRRPQETRVTVLEGRVRISAGDGGAAQERSTPAREGSADSIKQNPVAANLGAGEAATITLNGQITHPAAVDTAQVSAWRERRLVFKASRLAEIAAEFNRYNRTPQISIEDASIGERRLTAVFNADDPASLVQFLTRNSDLTVEEKGGRLLIRLR